MAAMDGGPNPASAVAHVESRVWRIDLEQPAAPRGVPLQLEPLSGGTAAKEEGIHALAFLPGVTAEETRRFILLAHDLARRRDRAGVDLDRATRQRTERLARGMSEVAKTISEERFLAEIDRCFSCGSCFGCEACYMYCTAGCFTRLEEARPGMYFSLNLDQCQDCGKCIEVCPCGFLEVP